MGEFVHSHGVLWKLKNQSIVDVGVSILEVTGFLFKEGQLKMSLRKAHAVVLGISADDHPDLGMRLSQKWWA